MNDDSKANNQQPLNVGDPAPPFQLMASDCNECDVSDMAGEVIVIVFFSETFSEFTEEQSHIFVRLYRSLKNEDVNIIGIVPEPMATIDTFVDEDNIPFRILCDFDRVVTEQFGILVEHLDGLTMVARPSVFVIDRKGQIIYRWLREDPDSHPDITELKEVIRSAIKEPLSQ